MGSAPLWVQPVIAEDVDHGLLQDRLVSPVVKDKNRDTNLI
jgi:hypothetical protein